MSHEWMVENLLVNIDGLVNKIREQDELIQAAVHGLQEPLTVGDARRVQAMLAHHMIEQQKGAIHGDRIAVKNTPQIVMETLLQRIVETEAAVAILDITGVPTVDTLVAQPSDK